MRKNLLLALTTGIMMWLAFPPFKFGFIAYALLIPFFYLLENKSFGESFRWSYLTGFIACIGTLYWINWVTLPGGIATILFLPLYFSIYALIHNFLKTQFGERTIYLAPFTWTAVEYLRSLGEIGFPWISLAYTQTYYPALIQYASLTSIFGVSFWVVLLNVLLYRTVKCRNNKKAVLLHLLSVLILFIIPWVYGKLVMSRDHMQKGYVTVSLAQGNIDPVVKWDSAQKDFNFDTYERLSNTAAHFSPLLLVWPETATPCNLRYEPEYLGRVKSQVDSLGIPLLTGTPDYLYEDGKFNAYNSAFLIQPRTAKIKSYAKMQLVPFGERAPYQDNFPFKYIKKLLDTLELGQGDWSRGSKVMVFSLPHEARTDSIRFSVPICYESVFPDLVRKFVTRGAEFLVIITNDAWFGKASWPNIFSGGLYQHAQIATFRAIENRIEIARCANTGISSFIDIYGRVKQSTEIFEEDVITDKVHLRTHTTFYTKYGNVFSYFVSVVTIFAVLSALYHKYILKVR